MVTETIRAMEENRNTKMVHLLVMQRNEHIMHPVRSEKSQQSNLVIEHPRNVSTSLKILVN